MGTLSIRPVTFAEIESAPNLPELLAEYARESANCAIGTPSMQPEIYRALESAGVLKILAAYSDGELVGYMSMLFSVLPHFGTLNATTESFFVAAAHRKGGTGLKLLRAAEALAASQGATGLFVSSPANGRLAQVLPRVGFHESNRVFFRRLP